MEKYIIDERTGWEYELKDKQYYPTGRVVKNGVMTPSEFQKDTESEEEYYIGVWGQRHLRYIRQYKKNLYFNLYLSGKLNAYLADVNTQAEDMFFRLVKEMSKREGLTETLKAEDQLSWAQHSNSIHQRAREIVNHELIFI